MCSMSLDSVTVILIPFPYRLLVWSMFMLRGKDLLSLKFWLFHQMKHSYLWVTDWEQKAHRVPGFYLESGEISPPEYCLKDSGSKEINFILFHELVLCSIINIMSIQHNIDSKRKKKTEIST